MLSKVRFNELSLDINSNSCGESLPAQVLFLDFIFRLGSTQCLSPQQYMKLQFEIGEMYTYKRLQQQIGENAKS